MGVRNCAEIGENLQRIMARLMANDDLVKLLYYDGPDPLSETALTENEKKEKIYNKLIRIVPKVTDKETAQCILTIRVSSANSVKENDEFKLVQIDIESFVPLTSWIIRNSNLRPFAILGEIQKSLSGKTINGLGKMEGGDFELSFLTEQISCYEAHYTITSYD